MASNRFGTIFTITTFGESHGKAMGVVIDGCPAGLPLDEACIQEQLHLRAPGKSPFTSPRKESDQAEIYSGVFAGKTTGAPIAIIIQNRDADPDQYQTMQNILRPGHANFTYLEKYGVFDHRGGGRASARETVCRVAAGAVAQQLLRHYDIHGSAYLKQVGNIALSGLPDDLTSFNQATLASAIFCPDRTIEQKMMAAILSAKEQGDSLGGVVGFVATGLPIGLGDPVYEKFEAKLAHAMMSLPASKGFAIGEGFHAAFMRGSEHNDAFTIKDSVVTLQSNHAGGLLGGISTGQPLFGEVVFKPTSSIRLPQASVTTSGEATTLQLPESARHDPCVAIRAVPVVSAMLALVLADALMQNRLAKV